MDEPPQKPPPVLHATVAITGIPVLEAMLRRQMADMLRAAASDVSPEAADELRQIAAIFETGLREDV